MNQAMVQQQQSSAPQTQQITMNYAKGPSAQRIIVSQQQFNQLTQQQQQQFLNNSQNQNIVFINQSGQQQIITSNQQIQQQQGGNMCKLDLR